MASNGHSNGNGTQSHRSFVNTEAIVLGWILGVVLIWLSVSAIMRGVHILHSPIEETLSVTILLTAVVAWSGFKLPTLFTGNARLATFTLVALCGFISLFFDSFAVILLLSTVSTTKYDSESESSHRFSDFVMRVLAAFNALTVGGVFYLGELWGLPHYISSGMANPIAGLPLAAVLFPYCLIVAGIAAWKFPVNVEKVAFDSQQIKGGLKLVLFLTLLIVTQNPILVLGILLLFSAITGRTQQLFKATFHELSEGGMAAVGLIAAAWVLQAIPGTVEFFKNVEGIWVLILAAISSPFAGAMIPASETLSEFYWNISYLMLGAPVFIWSSLVAIVVFKDWIDYEDMPDFLKKLEFMHNKGLIHEGIVYTMLVIPLTVGLGILLFLFNHFGIFVSIAEFMSIHMAAH